MSAETALKIVDKVEQKALSVVDQAKAITVTDSETYTVAGEMWKSIGDMMKEVDDTFNPIITAAHTSHKKALEQKAKYYKPLDDARRNIKRLMSDYDMEQERIRKEEERRLQEEARKREEERRLQEALEAEAAGEKEEAEAILEEPVYVAPVVVQKSTPKMTGGPIYQERWFATVTNIKDLCRAVANGQASPECVLPNMPVLNKLAVALKTSMNVPGVRAESKRV